MSSEKESTAGAKWDWCRFSAYQLQNGRICPSPGAALVRYDPNLAFENWENGEENEQPPYISLLNLTFRTMESASETDVTWDAPPSGLWDEWAAWFTAHGLLGVLPHQLLRVSYCNEVKTGPSTRPGTYVHCVTYYRKSGTWLPDTHSRLRETTVELMVLDGAGPTIKNLMGGEAEEFINQFSKDGFWGKAVLPIPLTTDFWRCYAEPWAVSFHGARMLVDAALTWLDPANRLDEGDGVFEALLDGVGYSILMPDQGGTLFRNYASLLAAYAFMVASDLASGKLHLCQECRQFFASTAYQSSFCSANCRSRHNMRQLRLRQKASKLHEQGLSVAEIAKKLGLPNKDVRHLLKLPPAIRKLRKVGDDG